MFVTALLVVPFYRLLARVETAAQPPAAEVVESAVSEPRRASRRLAESEPRVLAGFRAQEDALLTSYGWIEKDKGIARIPIERGDQDRGRARPAEVRGAGRGAVAAREARGDAPRARSRSCCALLPALAAAQMGAAPPPRPATPGVLQEVGFDQRLGESVPLDLAFTDETGRSVKLSDYFGKRPVVLSLVYYRVPDAVHASA